MTNTVKHSPAPWSYRVSENCPDVWEIIADFCESSIAEVPRWQNEDGSDSEEAEANAAIMTAAPEMFAALQLAQGALNTAPRFRVGDTDSYRIAATVDKAIAKATAA
jgi:hypothetical protein